MTDYVEDLKVVRKHLISHRRQVAASLDPADVFQTADALRNIHECLVALGEAIRDEQSRRDE